MTRFQVATKYAEEVLGFYGVLEELGSGSYAEVYGAGDLVIKCTDDVHDLVLSDFMIGQTSQHIVKTFRTAIVPRYDYYIIVNEKLSTIVDSYEVPYDKRSKITYDIIEEAGGGGFFTGYFIRYTLEEYKEELVSVVSNMGYIEGDLKIANNVVNQLIAIYKECKKLRFRNMDLHSENVGYDKNGVLKLLDIGHNSSNGLIKPTIETFKLCIKEQKTYLRGWLRVEMPLHHVP